tara:strand:- start:1736 stop:2008 length:273 start_codon:yes stop_codon:yes gene_type:complete
LGAFVFFEGAPILRDISDTPGSQTCNVTVLVTGVGKNNPMRLKTAPTGICKESHTLKICAPGPPFAASDTGSESSGFLAKSAVVRKNLTV